MSCSFSGEGRRGQNCVPARAGATSTSERVSIFLESMRFQRRDFAPLRKPEQRQRLWAPVIDAFRGETAADFAAVASSWSPRVSYLILRGRSRACGSDKTWQS